MFEHSALALCLLALLPQSSTPLSGTPYRKVTPGAQMRSMAERSKYFKMHIKEGPAPYRRWKLGIDVDIENVSGKAIQVALPVVVYDVFDATTHQRATDTPNGCFSNFMSPCYRTPHSLTGEYVRESYEAGEVKHITSPLDAFYQIEKGHTYVVHGYFCTEKRDGEEGECIKSNIVQVMQP